MQAITYTRSKCSWLHQNWQTNLAATGLLLVVITSLQTGCNASQRHMATLDTGQQIRQVVGIENPQWAANTQQTQQLPPTLRSNAGAATRPDSTQLRGHHSIAVRALSPQLLYHQRQQTFAGWLRRLLGSVPFPGPNDPSLKPDPHMPAHFQKKWFEVFQQQWKDYHKSLEAVRVGNASLLKLVEPLAVRNATLVNPAQLKRGISHLGAMHRIRRVLHDMQSGKPIKVAVLGGSISWGSAVERGDEDWFTLVINHLKLSYPNSNITGRNWCVPATPSSFMNMCLEQHMDDDVDLVFLEYAVNDGWDVNNIIKRKTYERLMRKVLNKPKHPAVILLQLPTVGMAFSSEHSRKAPFHKTIEDTYGLYAAYYDTPYLSMRNALWRLAELHHYQMNFTHFYGMTYDFIHPLEPGHRLIADLVLFTLQQVLIDLHLHPWSSWDQEEVAAPLPKPMFDGNWEEVNRLCTHGKAFESVVTSAKGWQMVNEGDEFKPKYGFVTQEVGSELEITVNTTRSTSPELKHVNVQLAYLRSYSNMGLALVRCHGGCECPETLVNGHHDLRQSTIYLLRLYPTQADKCKISATVQSETHSKGHKFKVTGVMVNEFRNHGDDEQQAQEALNKEEWLGGVNKGEGELRQKWSKATKQHTRAASSSNMNSTSGVANQAPPARHRHTQKTATD